MSIIDDEFKVSNYINSIENKIDSLKDDYEKSVAASNWAKEARSVIILYTKDLSELENQWIEFNSMTHKKRRESDWKSIEIFGFSNQFRYELFRSAILGYDIDNEIDREFDSLIQKFDLPVTESYIGSYAEDIYASSADDINYSSLDVENARIWSKEYNRVIIIPTRTLQELENLWDAFQSMQHKHCRESDWKSTELFGVTNLRHYEYLKNQFLRQNLSNEDKEKYGSVVEYATNPDIGNYMNELAKTDSNISVAKSLLEMSIPNNGIYEDRLVSNVINTTIDTMDDISQANSELNINYGDLPYYTPEEMDKMGVYSDDPADNFYGVIADNANITDTVSVAEWFNMYRATHDGFYTEFSSISSDWVNKVRSLMYGLNRIKESGDQNAINSRKQSILELGWNPEIEFTNKARKVCRECTAKSISKNIYPSKVIDLRAFREYDISNLTYNKDTSTEHDDKLYPVYIVLSEGKTFMSAAIKGVTHSIYSHTSIAFDHTLEKMYSFGITKKDVKGLKGGFREENIKDNEIDKSSRIDLFAFFVPKNIYNKIKDMVDSFINNSYRTKYSYTNIITYLFNVPYNDDLNMICSQFVDRCLKAAGINIIDKDSSLVSPEDMDVAAKKNSRIYNIYSGTIRKYNPSRTFSIVNSLKSVAAPIKEGSTYLNDERSYLIGVINNIDNIPVLKEMRYRIDVVKNPKIKDLLEKYVFNCLDIIPYTEIEKVKGHNSDFIYLDEFIDLSNKFIDRL